MSRRNLILVVLGLIVLFEVVVPDKYARVLGVHLDVLGSMTHKAGAMAAAGKRPTPNDLTELSYPLGRARGFVEDYGAEGERESFREFVELLDLYEGFVLAIDEARSTSERWEVFLPQMPARVASLVEAVSAVRAALAAES